MTNKLSQTLTKSELEKTLEDKNIRTTISILNSDLEKESKNGARIHFVRNIGATINATSANLSIAGQLSDTTTFQELKSINPGKYERLMNKFYELHEKWGYVFY